MIQSHVNICRENGKEQSDQSKSSKFAKCRDKYTDTAYHFAHTANIDQQQCLRQPWRHYTDKNRGMDEMQNARDDKQCSKQPNGNSPKY